MTLRRVEPAFALLLLLWAAVLHGAVFVSAGALWRDEANSIRQARLPSWSMLWQSLPYDSFPAFFPAVLRIWSGHPWSAGDQGLRLFGLLTGLGLLASIFFTARMLETKWPIVTLALLASNAFWIAEGDSIRPYGMGLIFLMLAFGFVGRDLARPSRVHLVLATLMSVLAVQTSYTGSLSVGAICLGAVFAGLWSGRRWGILRYLVPGFIAATSLIPCAGVLRHAREWAAIVNRQVEWPQFFGALAHACNRPVPIIWLCFLLLSAWSLTAPVTRRAGDDARHSPLLAYELSVLALGLAAQLLFVKAAGVPFFPRYFLPVAAFAAFVFESALSVRRVELRASAAIAALILSAGPSWSWARVRHSNADDVGAALGLHAAPRDLVVISPWFLHTSFQRYYHGPCAWITIPVLEHAPLTRYDLVKRAIVESGSAEEVAQGLRSTLERGGAVWFVSQRPWTNLSRTEMPEVPAAPQIVGGADYERFRSYWERDIEYRLNACCTPEEIDLRCRTPVWDEEDLMLTRWSKKQR